MNFLSPWVSFMCYVYSTVLVWCFQIVISEKYTKWQRIVAIEGKWQLSTTVAWLHYVYCTLKSDLAVIDLFSCIHFQVLILIYLVLPFIYMGGAFA